MAKIIVNCDGGARGNPGPAAAAFVVTDNGKNTLYKGAKYLGESTNNVAEYSAVLLALEWVFENKKKLKTKTFSFLLDSELAVNQLNGVYKIKNTKLKEMVKKIRELLEDIGQPVYFSHVARENNALADILVNNTLDSV